jgi:hypothetical protein
MRPPECMLFIIRMIYKHRAKVEWYWQRKPKNSEKTLSQYHFVHHKLHMERPGLEPEPPRRGDLTDKVDFSICLISTQTGRCGIKYFPGKFFCNLRAVKWLMRFGRLRAPARRLECLLVIALHCGLEHSAHTKRVCGLSSFCANSAQFW